MKMKMGIRKSIENRISKNYNYLIIAVGDSVTWGLNHCSEEETYCAELARLFAKSMPEANIVRYDGIVKEERRPLYGYSERFYNNYAVLCDMHKNSNRNAEIVLMTPTYNDEGTDTQSCLDPYCEEVIELARQKGLRYIDMHKPWMEHYSHRGLGIPLG